MWWRPQPLCDSERVARPEFSGRTKILDEFEVSKCLYIFCFFNQLPEKLIVVLTFRGAQD
jgi:hypothetical protein